MKSIVKFTFLLFVANTFAIYKCVGQTISFNKEYDRSIDGLFNVQTTDTGYNFVMLGGYPIMPLYAYFTFINNYGDTVKQIEFGSDSDYLAMYTVLSLNDSVKVFGGYCYNDTLNKVLLKLFFINNYGDSISTKNFIDPDSGKVWNSNIIRVSDGGILATGQYEDSLNTDGSILIIKLDSTGNFLWKSVFGGIRYDAGFTSIETPDKGFLTLGWTRSFGFGNNSNRDMILVKWDSLGNKLWHRTYGTIDFDGGNGITATADGNYLLAGYRGVANNKTRCWIQKIDPAGNVIWSHTYDDGSGELWWAKERFDGTIVAAGSSDDNFVNYDDGYIVKTDSLGILQWDRLFNINTNHCYFRDFDFTLDGGYICAGFAFTGASGNQDAWLVKLDSLGCDSIGCAAYVGLFDSPQNKEEEIVLFPNPVHDILQIKFDFPYAGALHWTLYTAEGKLIKQRPEYVMKYFSINVSDLNPGMYLLQLKTDTGRTMKKFFKQ
ncbi:MAG: T9SS type A sorting domain-containing protein [Bacteroidetes bacterium]|nr:T9SS type A sorting domain-containing protein [Bacteroidota bacterium]